MNNNSTRWTSRRASATTAPSGGAVLTDRPPIQETPDLSEANRPRSTTPRTGRTASDCACLDKARNLCGIGELVPATSGGGLVLPTYFHGSCEGKDIVVIGDPGRNLVVADPAFFAASLIRAMRRYGTPASTQIIAGAAAGTIPAPNANALYNVFGMVLTHSVNQNGSMADFTFNVAGQREEGEAFGPQQWLYTSPAPENVGRLLMLFFANENGDNVPTNLQVSDASYNNGGRYTAVAAQGITVTYSSVLPVGHTVSLRGLNPRDPEMEDLVRLLKRAARLVD